MVRTMMGVPTMAHLGTHYPSLQPLVVDQGAIAEGAITCSPLRPSILVTIPSSILPVVQVAKVAGAMVEAAAMVVVEAMPVPTVAASGAAGTTIALTWSPTVVTMTEILARTPAAAVHRAKTAAAASALAAQALTEVMARMEAAIMAQVADV